MAQAQSGTKKEPLDKALNLNGGNSTSYIEPFIQELSMQLADKNSVRLVYLLNKWMNYKAA